MSGAHSSRAPSSSHRWINCPGSVKLEADAEDTSGPDALLGTAVHFLNELRVLGFITAIQITQLKGQKMSSLGSFAEVDEEIKHIEITEEMIDCVQEWVLFVKRQIPEGFGTLDRDFVRVEEKVKTSIPGVEGTADLIAIDPFVSIHIIDYKNGVEQVDAENNPQLACYALGALEKFGTNFETVKMTIFQPRGKGPTEKTWEIPLAKFYGPWIKKLTNAVEEIEKKPDLKRHGEWCKHCKGVAKCDRVVRKAKTLRREVDTAAPLPKETKDLLNLLKYKTAILEYFKEAEKCVSALLHSGQEVKGFKLVQSLGNRSWRNEEATMKNLGSMVDESELYVSKAKSPSQIEKTFKKIGWALPTDFHTFITRKDKGAIMVPETDKREAYKPITAAEAFKDEGENNAS